MTVNLFDENKWSKFQCVAVALSVLFFLIDYYYVSAGQQHHHVFYRRPGRILLGSFLLSGGTIAMAIEMYNDWRAYRLCQVTLAIHAVVASGFLYYALRF
jgi:hypothetical protein